MKKFIMTAAILGLTATGAMAQSAQRDINLTATVPAFCTMGAPSDPTLDFGVPANLTGDVDYTEKTTGLSVVCNAAAKVTLTSTKGAMVAQANETAAAAASVPTGFSNIIEYTAAASGPGFTTVSLNTASGTDVEGVSSGATNNTTGAINATLTVGITAADPGNPLLANTYTDTLTVKIEPQ